jgi:hypothetical protein
MSARQCKSNNTFKDENFGKKWRIITFEFTVNNLAESSMMLETELVCLGKKSLFFSFSVLISTQSKSVWVSINALEAGL